MAWLCGVSLCEGEVKQRRTWLFAASTLTAANPDTLTRTIVSLAQRRTERPPHLLAFRLRKAFCVLVSAQQLYRWLRSTRRTPGSRLQTIQPAMGPLRLSRVVAAAEKNLVRLLFAARKVCRVRQLDCFVPLLADEEELIRERREPPTDSSATGGFRTLQQQSSTLSTVAERL